MTDKKRKMVIDCDPGKDDASAIFMALSDPDVDLVAITCVEGNTNVRQTALNALRTLKVADRLDIPVFAGSNLPLLGDRKSGASYHGNDGLGDVPDPTSPEYSHVQDEHGVQTLIRLQKIIKIQMIGNNIIFSEQLEARKGCRGINDEIELVAIGPLTNLALALRLDPDLGSRLKSCWIMGGNYLGKGNSTVSGEFNFYFDPEAAYVVLNELGCPITIVPWETCVQHGLKWDVYDKLRSIETEKAEFMKAVDRHSIVHVKKKRNRVFITADEALMACTLDSDVIKTSVQVYATVETKGQYTWGQMVVDWQGILQKAPNVTIVTEMDQTLYEKLLHKGFE